MIWRVLKSIKQQFLIKSQDIGENDMEDELVASEEKKAETPPRASDNTAISHVEVHEVVGLIVLGIVSTIFLIFLKKSQDRYIALIDRLLEERR